jgi:uncharacterized protein (DUF927 family)
MSAFEKQYSRAQFLYNCLLRTTYQVNLARVNKPSGSWRQKLVQEESRKNSELQNSFKNLVAYLSSLNITGVNKAVRGWSQESQEEPRTR